MSLRLAPDGIPGLPTNEPYVLLFGSGVYRQSKAYLAAVPVATFETGERTIYYAGMGSSGPTWSAQEDKAEPIIRDSTIGDISVTYVADAGVWVALYDSRSPIGVLMRYASQPWGPWSQPQVLFEPHSGLGTFIHDPNRNKDDGLAGPLIEPHRSPQKTSGGFYAPYIIDRFTRVEGDKLQIEYVLSTWNPYVVVRMRSSLQVRP